MNIVIIGAGAMGSSLARQLATGGYKITVTDHDKQKLKQLARVNPKIKITTDNVSVIGKADLIILGVKPQSFNDLAVELKSHVATNAVVLSIMAGVNLGKIRQLLSVKKVVRAMPNLCAQIGKSTTVWTARGLSVVEKRFVVKIFNCIGIQKYVKTEVEIDKATAVSGSGPGFLFAIISAWLKAIEAIGFTRAEAELVWRNTVDGANTLWQSGKQADELLKRVASKGGTTEAGLKVLSHAKLEKLFERVLRAAWLRAEDLQKK